MLPLARPGTVAAMTLLFILAIRELGSSLFLYTSDTMVMAVLLLDYYEGEYREGGGVQPGADERAATGDRHRRLAELEREQRHGPLGMRK